MLISFAAKNFLSFKDRVELNMLASNKLTERDTNIIRADEDINLLKSAVIFGPNAGGKTNLLLALKRFQQIIVNSFKETQEGESLRITPFVLNENSKNEPTEFEIVFLANDIIFDYKVVLSSEKIFNETLLADGEEIFVREDNKIQVSKNSLVSEDSLNKRAEFARENSLFVSVLAATNASELKPFMDFFVQNFHLFTAAEQMPQSHTAEILKNKDKFDKILEIIRKVDFGIQNLSTKKIVPTIPDEIKNTLPEEVVQQISEGSVELQTYHHIYSEKGNVVGQMPVIANGFESSGTNSFLAFIGPIVDSLADGHVLLIDELDALLHPTMTNFLVELINGEFNNGAQIIFTTHNTHHLNSGLFRRDQIWFVEKDNFEISHLTSLAEYKRRKDENYEINYLKGKYGALPIIKKNIQNEIG